MPPINGSLGEVDDTKNAYEGRRGGSQGVILDDKPDDGPPKKATVRKTRYGRSATTSVTQLLSTSCNTLLQKFRRNPSERPEKKLARSANSQQR